MAAGKKHYSRVGALASTVSRIERGVTCQSILVGSEGHRGTASKLVRPRGGAVACDDNACSVFDLLRYERCYNAGGAAALRC